MYSLISSGNDYPAPSHHREDKKSSKNIANNMAISHQNINNLEPVQKPPQNSNTFTMHSNSNCLAITSHTPIPPFVPSLSNSSATYVSCSLKYRSVFVFL